MMAAPSGAVRPAAARAPGKAILFGEHFVVHGGPAVACAIGRGATASVEPMQDGTVRVDSPLGPCEALRGEDMPGGLPAPLAAVCGMAVSAAGRAGAGLRVGVDGELPLGSGLGSSSAWCVAAAAALRAALGEERDADSVAAAALEAERGAFGGVSGVDTAACAYGGFGSYRAAGSGAGWRPLAAGCRLRLVAADTGEPHSTAEMVGKVSMFREKERAEFDAMAKESARLALYGELSIGGGDASALGKHMSEAHALLSRLGVSTGAADALAVAAEDAGSPGAKITGAGGGGCVIAVPGPGSDGELHVAEAMMSAGAADCFATDIGVEGVREVLVAPHGARGAGA